MNLLRVHNLSIGLGMKDVPYVISGKLCGRLRIVLLLR